MTLAGLPVAEVKTKAPLCGEEVDGRTVGGLNLQKGTPFLFLFPFSYFRQAKSAESDAKKDEEDEDVLSSIEIGDNLPDIVLKNEKGKDIQVADLAAEHGVVLFLVPKADTCA